MPEARQLWQPALGELQLLMTRANYETWLKQSQGLGFDGEVLRVGVHSPFTQEALATRFAPLVRRTLASVIGRPVEVRYEVTSPEPESPVRGEAAPLFRSSTPAGSATLTPTLSQRERENAPSQRERGLESPASASRVLTHDSR